MVGEAVEDKLPDGWKAQALGHRLSGSGHPARAVTLEAEVQQLRSSLEQSRAENLRLRRVLTAWVTNRGPQPPPPYAEDEAAD